MVFINVNSKNQKFENPPRYVSMLYERNWSTSGSYEVGFLFRIHSRTSETFAEVNITKHFSKKRYASTYVYLALEHEIWVFV